MKITDLRIGNFVNENFKIIAIHKNTKLGSKEEDYFYSAHIETKTDFGNIKIKGLRPIRLTKTWLKRFGINTYNRFSEVYKIYVDEKTNRVVYLKLKNVGNNPEWIFEFYQNKDCFKKTIKYVHELQNLYASITNYELNVVVSDWL